MICIFSWRPEFEKKTEKIYVVPDSGWLKFGILLSCYITFKLSNYWI